jgi:predicted TIM-barrel fold metal-dependent hydrolase
MPHWTGETPPPRDFVKEMHDRNVRAVLLYPGHNAWNLTSRTARPLLDELERTRTLCIVEAPAEASWKDLEQVLTEHPELPILMRGIPWSQQRGAIPLLLAHKNLHVGFDQFQISYGPEWLVEHGCEDQLVYCSNATDMAMGAHRFYVDYADIPPEARRKFAGGNLTRLLKGLAPPREIINKDEDPVMAEARQGKPLSPLVIDFHAHILDEGCQGAGSAYTMWRGGPEDTYKLAKRMGVDFMGLMSWNGTVGAQAEEGNRCVKAALDSHPDFYWGLGTFDVVHRTADEMRKQMEELFADKRFLGLKPYPSYGVPYSDPRFDCWWEFGNARKLYCGIHPVNWYQAAEFDSICSRFPDLTVVAYHAGGDWSIADTCIALAKKYANFMMEITLTPVNLGIIDYLVENTSADRVMYGSDLPMRDPRPQLGWAVFSRLKYEDKLKVLGGNARRLLDRIRAANA